MDARLKSSRRKSFRPICESLESLKLLSTLTPAASGAGLTPMVSLSSAPTQSITTAIGNGDGHPSGVAVVPSGFPTGGLLKPGSFLVSNSEKNGVPRTGSTIIAVSTVPSTSSALYFQGQTSTGVGLTSALAVLPRGVTIAGSFPPSATSSTQLGQAMLTVVDANGNSLTQIQAPGGPLALTAHSQGKSAQVFVSNALTGTITRIDMQVSGNKVIISNEFTVASGYNHASESPTSTAGPSGLAYDASKDVLYVASPGDNMVYEVKQAGKTRKDHGMGQALTTDTSHFHGPASVALTPSGSLLVTNNDTVNPDSSQPSELTQFSSGGAFLGQQSISAHLGAAGGVAISSSTRHNLKVAVANDDTNTLDIYQGTD